MKKSDAEVNVSWEQLPMFHAHGIKIVLEVLLDPEDESVVIATEARSGPSGPLLALKTIPPRHYSEAFLALATAVEDLKSLVRNHTAPF